MMAKLFVYTMPLIYIHAAKVYTSARPTEVYSTFTFASYAGYGTKAISIVYSLSIGAMHGTTKWYHKALHMKHWNLGDPAHHTCP